VTDTKSDLRWKADAAFALGALVTVCAVYLCFTTLPRTKVAHGRFWIVAVVLLVALLCCGVGILDRHLSVRAPETRPLPTAAQTKGAKALAAGQALAMLTIGTVQLVRGNVGIGCMGLVAGVAFVGVLLLMRHEPTRS
jgi:hypothetical protein